MSLRKDKRKSAERSNRRPVCVGSGFVALDLIYIGNGQAEPDFTFVGGSCDNVLTILAFLGWDSVPVIRLKDNKEAARLIADLEKCDHELFAQAVGLADVVKYASNRLQPGHIAMTKKWPSLEIQTMGAEGLRFRWRAGEPRRQWRKLPATKVAMFKDAAGSGDWCSAGIIHILAKGGYRGFARVNEARLLHALNCGQRLAALNCAYEGARGAMYHVDFDEVSRILRRVTP
jgi:sugar/nucleoside kinase (ribokinase family)